MKIEETIALLVLLIVHSKTPPTQDEFHPFLWWYLVLYLIWLFLKFCPL